MKSLFLALFSVVVLSWAAKADSCDEQIKFEVDHPAYVGNQSMWTDLRILFQGAANVTNSDADFQRPGVCFYNPTPASYPHAGVIFLAPAMATKEGDKFLVLLDRGYNLVLDPWAPGEEQCLYQIKNLQNLAKKYMTLPPEKISYSYGQGQFSYTTPSMLFPSSSEIKVVNNLMIVKRSETEYCAFRR